jgi:hypothetical protein
MYCHSIHRLMIEAKLIMHLMDPSKGFAILSACVLFNAIHSLFSTSEEYPFRQRDS